MITFNGNQFLSEISQRIDQSANDIGKWVVKEAMLNTAGGRLGLHLRTGQLHSSISYAYDNQSHAISFIVAAPYGIFVEYGTRHSRAFPYMRAALNAAGTIFGFETSLEFQNVIQTDTKLLSHGPTYQMHKSLSERQKAHVRTKLKPVAERHHVGNVSRAKLKVRHKF